MSANVAFAPGKLLLSGAYAVLEGAPAIVLAVSRGAIANADERAEHVSAELREALAGTSAEPPHVSVTALFQDEKKLGLGASAAGLVAALGALALRDGADLALAETRHAIFEKARAAHARAQQGGSGVDIASSTYGGLLAYAITESRARIAPLEFPEQLTIEGYFAGSSASTTSMRARVDALKTSDRARFDAVMRPLVIASNDANSAIARGDVTAFIAAVSASTIALSALGQAADAPIVLPSFHELARVAEAENAAFSGSGAGGGDVAVYVGPRSSSSRFRERATALGLSAFAFERDTLGLRRMD